MIAIGSDHGGYLLKEEIKKQFDMGKAEADFSACTIVLSETDDTLHFDVNDPKTKEILKIRKEREENVHFCHSLENFLAENDDFSFTEKEILQIKINLLMKLRISTYEECIKEYKGTSFTKLLQENITKYNKIKTSLSQKELNENDYESELDEIYELLDELKKRAHDKYQAKILEIAVPEILNEELLTDVLHVKSKFVKNVKKPNGFCADYYELTTNDGRKIEVQAITKMRFKESKDGSSDHSKLPNKEIDISQFFEPTNDECDEKSFKKMLEILKNTPIEKRNTLYLSSDQCLPAMDKRLKRKLKAAEQNVKLKDVYIDDNNCKYTLDEYLKQFAEYVSPKMMSVSSHHTRFNKGIAGYNSKSAVSNFREVLLKQDSTSCLSQMLVDRYEMIVTPNDKNEISRNGIIERASVRYKEDDDEKNVEH